MFSKRTVIWRVQGRFRREAVHASLDAMSRFEPKHLKQMAGEAAYAHGAAYAVSGAESWSIKFGRSGEWISCLTVAMR